MENLSNITLFWTKAQRPNAYARTDHTLLNYATLNPDLRQLQLHYSAPDPVQPPNSVAIKSKQFTYYNRFFVVQYLVGNRFEIVAYRFEPATNAAARPAMIRTQSLSYADERVDFDLIQHQGNVYLAVSVNQGNQGEVRLYKWNRIQFDLAADQKSETLAGIDSLKLFKMSGTVYIATSASLASRDSKTAYLFSYQDTGKIYDSLRLMQKLRLENGNGPAYPNPPNARGSSKIESFSVHGNHYLLFIGPHDARIFWWLKSQFIEFQKIPNTAFARDADVAYLPSNEAIISLVSYSNDLRFYTESVNGEYTATFSRRFYANNQHIRTASLVPFRKTHYYVFFTFTRSQPDAYYNRQADYYPIYHLNLTAVKAFKERTDPLMNCLDRLNYNIRRSEQGVQSLKQRTGDVWLRNREQTILAPVFVDQTVEVRSAARIGFLNIKSSIITNETRAVDIVDNLKHLQGLMGQHQAEVNTNVLLKNDLNQNVQSFVSFVQPVSGSQVNVDEFNDLNLRVNNVSLADLTYNTLKQTGVQVIPAPLAFANNLKINHLKVKSMNGLNLDDVLLTQSDRPQNVTGRYEFNNLLVNNDIQLRETINRLNLDQLVKLNPSQSVQVITGDKIFNIVDFKAGLRVAGLVNNGDVRKLAENAIKLNSNQPQVCYGKLVFQRDIQTSKLEVAQPINERVNVDEMLRFGLRKQGDQQILGNVRLNSLVTVNGDLKVAGQVNNLNLESDLLNVHGHQKFNGELVFRRPLTMLNNLNAFMVNSINFTNELVYRNSPTPQFVVSHKTFDQDLVINNNLTMKDGTTIDYVDPSELVRHALSNVKRTFGAVTFDSLRILGNLQTNKINEIPLKNLTSQYWIKNYQQVIDVPVSVNAPTKIQRMHIQQLNGHQFPADYVVNKPNTEQLITGGKVFVNAAVLNGSFITSPNTKMNGLNLNRLDSRIVQNLQLVSRRDNSTVPDFIGGHKKFQTLEVEGNLFVNRLNGMRLDEDILLRNSPREQLVVGKKQFQNNQFVNVLGSVGVGEDLSVRDSINKVNLYTWLQDVVLKGTPEIHNRLIESKQFVGRVDTGELRLGGLLSGVNFTNLLQRAVYLDDRSSDISVPIIFNDLVFFDRVRLEGKLNGYDPQIYERSLIYKRPGFNHQRNQPLIITGRTNILGALSVESNLKSVHPLTTIDLGRLQNRMLSRSRMNIITAPFVFEKDVRANQMNLIGPNARINNVNPNDFVRLNGNVTLPGRLVIEDALDVVNSLNVATGSINRHNINEMYRNAVNRFGNVHLSGAHGDVIFKYLDVKGSLHTKDKLLDDIHLENEYKSKVIDAKNVIETPLIFTDPVSVGNLIIRNRINGVRFDQIIKDAVLKSVPQTVAAAKVFVQDLVPRNRFTVHHAFNITGLLNRARLDVLNRVLLRKSIGGQLQILSAKYFNKPVYFERDLQVAGAINKLRLPADLVLSATNERVNTTVIFKEPVEFIGQLDVLGTYNGWPVRKTLVDRVDRNQHNLEHNPITSSLAFADKVMIGELVVLRSINGIPIHLLIPSNLNRNGPANLLQGKFVFDGNVKIIGDLNIRNGQLNGVNLANLAAQTIRINSNDYVPGRVIVDRRFTFNHTILNGKLNGIDLRRFRDYYLQKKLNQENYFKGVLYSLNQKDQRLERQVGSAFRKQTYLEYFENYDEFDPLDANGRELIFDRFLTTPFVVDNQFDGDYIMHPTINHLTAWRIVNRKKRAGKNTNSYCDHYETWSYSLNEYDDLVLQEEKIVHRAFPAFKLTFKSNAQSDKDEAENTFYLWSNTTGCHLKANPYDRYARENIPFEVTLLYTSQFTEIGKLKRRIHEPHSHKGADRSAMGRLDGVSAVMEDARFFTDKNNNHFAFVAFSYSKVLAQSAVNSTLFEFSQTKNRWMVRQQVLSEGAVAIDMVHYYPPNSMSWYESKTQNQRITLLAIANRLSKYDRNRRNVVRSSVYAFDDASKQLRLIAQLPTFSPKSVLFLPVFKSLKYENSTVVRQAEHEELFLIYANEKLRYYDECSTHEDLTLEHSGSGRSSLFNQGVSIYRVAKSNLTFTLHQQLDIVGSVTLDKFYLPSDQAYLVVGSKILHKTFVYYYDRSTGQFALVQTISSPSVENVKLFWSRNGHLYLAIASSQPGASKRLKAVINGPNPFYLKNLFLESK